MMSFLPLAHMLERCCENAMYYSGGSVGFYSGDIRELTNDMKALRPTVMPAVPRLLNRVYDKVQNELGRSGVRRMLFNWALRSKEAEIKRGILRRDSLWDRLVFKKVQEGNVRMEQRVFHTDNAKQWPFSFALHRLRRQSAPDGGRFGAAGRQCAVVHPLCPGLSGGGGLRPDRVHGADFVHGAG